MPPDALQREAYCTNPGLYPFLLAPPGVSTREPSSETRNYLGEKWPVIWTESCDFHAANKRRLYFPSEGRRAEDFFALKNPTASGGFEPANLGTKGQHATSGPPKPLREALNSAPTHVTNNKHIVQGASKFCW